MNTKAVSLSDDLVYEILSWLPAKSLIRYTSVCKSWYYTINHNSSFIKKHTTNFSRTNNRSILVMPYTTVESPINCTLYSGIMANMRSTVPLPFTPIRLGALEVVGSCNGLICVAYKYPSLCVYIWNPSIRKHKLLPPSSYQHKNKLSAFGFGYHNQSNDYRVVRITYYENIARTKVEVYSLNTNSWTRVNLVKPIKETRKASVFANGYIYWLATNTSILSFNIDNDSFEEITHPVYTGFSLKSYYIEVIGGRLCLLTAPYYNYYFTKNEEYEIWMMREDGVFKSWTKICKFKQQSQEISGTYGLSVKGEILQFKEGNDKCLSVYDHENLQALNICNQFTVLLAVTYMESLALLDMSRDSKSKRIEEAESSNKKMKLSFTEKN